MPYASNDSKLNPQDDVLAKTHLQKWLTGRKAIFRSETSLILIRLHGFAALVDAEDFNTATRKLGGFDVADLDGIPPLIGRLSELLSYDVRGTEREILQKSLHETLLYIADLDADLPVEMFGVTFEKFLRQRGSKGLLQLFLGLHLFNEVWIKLQQRLQTKATDGDSFLASMRWIEQCCLSAVDSAMKDMSRWPKLSRTLAESLIHAIEFRISNMMSRSSAA